jgi:hypothetical protein
VAVQLITCAVTTATSDSLGLVGFYTGPSNAPVMAGVAYSLPNQAGCWHTGYEPRVAAAGGHLRFWLGNQGATSSQWTVDTFHLTGYRYYLA